MSETGSLVTASSSGESIANLTFGAHPIQASREPEIPPVRSAFPIGELDREHLEPAIPVDADRDQHRPVTRLANGSAHPMHRHRCCRVGDIEDALHPQQRIAMAVKQHRQPDTEPRPINRLIEAGDLVEAGFRLSRLIVNLITPA
jgi:hypothetical protein